MEHQTNHRRVVITGMGAVSPLGSTLEQLREGFQNGRSGVRRITQFDASEMPTQIAGEIPDFIWEMEGLNFLNLHDNNFTGSIPAEIGNLNDLVYLSMGVNNLEGPLPGSIGNLTQLATLLLSDNSLSGRLPSEMGGMINLSSLKLNQNNFDGAVPESFTNLTSILTLYLDDNRLNDLPDLSSYTVLNNLRIQNNRFTFEDIEPNVGVPALSFQYAPQDSVGERIDTLVLAGSDLTLTMDVGGASNQYQWFKDGVPITGATGSEYPMHISISPRRMGGRYFSFCSSEPICINVGPTVLRPSTGSGISS